MATDWDPRTVRLAPHWPGRLRTSGFSAAEIPSGLQWSLQPTTRQIDGAWLLPLQRTGARGRQFIGGVYDALGEVVTEARRAKFNRVWSGRSATVDVRTTRAGSHLRGSTFFAGHHLRVFGHLLLEVLPRLWPDGLDLSHFDHVLFAPTRVGGLGSGRTLQPHELATLRAFGLREGQVRVGGSEPIRIDSLTVSSPTFALKRAVDPWFTRPFARVVDHYAHGESRADERVYLSRSHLGPGHRRATNEAAVERAFRDVGFKVVHPQELTIPEQVRLIRRTGVLVGCDGSSLHLAAFARPGTRLLSLDSRIVINQLLVDRVSGMDAMHVRAARTLVSDRATRWTVDQDAIDQAIAIVRSDDARLR